MDVYAEVNANGSAKRRALLVVAVKVEKRAAMQGWARLSKKSEWLLRADSTAQNDSKRDHRCDRADRGRTLR